MGSSFKTTDVNGELVDLGGDHLFSMPFLAVSGRLNYGDLNLTGSGGGAYFKGEMDGMDYEVLYYTFDLKGIYNFYKNDNWSLGFRKLFMDMYVENDLGWGKEKDNHSGPYMSIRAKFSSIEMWIN